MSDRGLDRVVVGKKNGYLMQERVDTLREESFVADETSAKNASKRNEFAKVPFSILLEGSDDTNVGTIEKVFEFLMVKHPRLCWIQE